MVAHPAGRLFSLANDSAEFSSRKIPPICPLASRATQKPALLRPMKNAGIASLTIPASRGRNCAVTDGGFLTGKCRERSASCSLSAVERLSSCRREGSRLISCTAIITCLSIASVCPAAAADQRARLPLQPVASGY